AKLKQFDKPWGTGEVTLPEHRAAAQASGATLRAGRVTGSADGMGESGPVNRVDGTQTGGAGGEHHGTRPNEGTP
ncbi:hypothetical protein ABK046_48070, partial [Streptomyces caeruleatus]